MRINVDETKCCGFGACVLTAEDLFTFDDETNLAVAIVESVPDHAVNRLDTAIQECPTAAISTSADGVSASGQSTGRAGGPALSDA